MSRNSTIVSQLQELLKTPQLPSLGPEPRVDRLSISEIDRTLKPVFQDAHFSSLQENLVRSLIYLWHDHLDESHTIAQDIHNADGSFVHGIMHRREPDAGNAKYWFHRVGRHAAFTEIAERVTAFFADGKLQTSAKVIRAGEWDPFGFIDACEQARGGQGGDLEVLERIQEIETVVLLEHICD